MRKLLVDRKETSAVGLDAELQDIQGHVQRVLGPLGTIWSCVEMTRLGPMELSKINVLRDQLQKAVILLGHSI